MAMISGQISIVKWVGVLVMFNFYTGVYLGDWVAGLFISDDQAYEVYFKSSGEVEAYVIDITTGYAIAW